MALPEFTTDLNIIQQLADEPNDVDGLSAQDLKKKFDEAGLTIQKWLNETLLPALIASNLGFTKTTEIPEETVQAAIVNVQAQVKNMAIGAVPNGSVNYLKLASDVTTLLTNLQTALSAAQEKIEELDERQVVIDPATQTANGLMSSTDKKKLDGIAEGATKVNVNSELSATSQDAIMNKVVYAALNKKANSAHSHVMADITDLSIDAAPAQGSGNPISSGGVFSALQNFKTATQYTGTLLSTGWAEDTNGYMAQTITITGLKASYSVDPQWDVALSGTDPDADAALLEGFALIHNFKTGANSLTAQCIGNAPEVNIPVKVVVFG